MFNKHLGEKRTILTIKQYMPTNIISVYILLNSHSKKGMPVHNVGVIWVWWAAQFELPVLNFHAIKITFWTRNTLLKGTDRIYI
jgi:hypothetical protein